MTPMGGERALLLPHHQDPFFVGLTLDIALKSRERHAPGLQGECLYCPGEQRWPCQPYVNADRTVRVLTEPEPAGFLRGDEYLQAALLRRDADGR